jgi:hypothetical protein
MIKCRGRHQRPIGVGKEESRQVHHLNAGVKWRQVWPHHLALESPPASGNRLHTFPFERCSHIVEHLHCPSYQVLHPLLRPRGLLNSKRLPRTSLSEVCSDPIPSHFEACSAIIEQVNSPSYQISHPLSQLRGLLNAKFPLQPSLPEGCFDPRS